MGILKDGLFKLKTKYLLFVLIKKDYWNTLSALLLGGFLTNLVLLQEINLYHRVCIALIILFALLAHFVNYFGTMFMEQLSIRKSKYKYDTQLDALNHINNQGNKQLYFYKNKKPNFWVFFSSIIGMLTFLFFIFFLLKSRTFEQKVINNKMKCEISCKAQRDSLNSELIITLRKLSTQGANIDSLQNELNIIQRKGIDTLGIKNE